MLQEKYKESDYHLPFPPSEVIGWPASKVHRCHGHPYVSGVIPLWGFILMGPLNPPPMCGTQRWLLEEPGLYTQAFLTSMTSDPVSQWKPGAVTNGLSVLSQKFGTFLECQPVD